MNRLQDVLNIQNKLTEKKDGLLKNQTFMLTGKLNELARAEPKSLMRKTLVPQSAV